MITPRNSHRLSGILLALELFSSVAVCAAAEDILIADFEGKDYGD